MSVPPTAAPPVAPGAGAGAGVPARRVRLRGTMGGGIRGAPVPINVVFDPATPRAAFGEPAAAAT